MKQSQLFVRTTKELPKDEKSINARLLTRAGFIDKLHSGVYSYLPLGLRVHKKIENIIRSEMEQINAQELFLPSLQPKSLWEETARWKTIDPPLFKLKDRHQKDLALGSTHEEVITDLVRKRVKSWRDLPLALFQIQNKFRNEMRATSGLLRVREFMMKDLYSFHVSEADLVKYYEMVKKAYFQIFKRCELPALCVQADPGTIGGKLSHEFVTEAKTGEDKVLLCKKCGFGIKLELSGKIKKCPKCKKGSLEEKRCIESAHAFYLGTKYSKAMGANFVQKSGEVKPIVMGCYGIGLGRLMATIVEVHHDENGIIWPRTVAPFQAHLVPIEAKNQRIKRATEMLYLDLQKNGHEVLYDDRLGKTAGEKFADADLIGIPTRIVISERMLKKNCVETKQRDKRKVKLVKMNYLAAELRGIPAGEFFR